MFAGYLWMKSFLNAFWKFPFETPFKNALKNTYGINSTQINKTSSQKHPPHGLTRTMALAFNAWTSRERHVILCRPTQISESPLL